ncbi:MAG TPA: response regulator [Gemmataceae bacterium]|nr:response regulator [Gemmataceae bacterium]
MPPSRLPGKGVLVVDDDWQTRYALRMALEAAGYAVREAANGEDALRLLQREPLPDVILLDMVMPVMNGWEFRQQQAREPLLANIPVVVFSAAYEAAPRAAESLGVARVLFKPVDCGEALASISDLFEAIEAR